MASQDCIDAIRSAAGDLSDDEMVQILETLRNERDAIRAADESVSLEEAALQAAEKLSRDMEQAAYIERRNAAINLRRRSEALAYIRNNWADRYDLGLESFLVGTNVSRVGSRASVAAEQKQLSQSYIAGFLNDMETSGNLGVLASGAMDREIANALWRLDQAGADFADLPSQAVDIAKAMRKWQEAARVDANKAGAAIGKLDNYIVRQSHDPYHLEIKGQQAWKDFILPRLDPKTFQGVKDVDKFLDEAYTGMSSGVHLKSTPSGGFTGPRNIAKKMSQERVLHFKDADSWLEYNKEFGTGSLREAFMGGLDRMGESTALMRKLGTNPEYNWNFILDELQKDLRGNSEALKQFNTDRKGKFAGQFDEVSGATRMPVNAFWARVWSNTRAWQSMAKLGGAVLSAVSDLPIAASELNYQGRSFLGSLGDVMGGLLEGKKTQEKRQILSSLGVFFDSMRGDVVSRFSTDDSLGGRMTRAQRLFFKANGLQWWTDAVRSAAALSMSHQLALNKGKSWGKLGDLRRVLEMYGLDEGKWDLIRDTSSKLADGREYFTLEALDEISPESLKSYLVSNGRKDSDAAVRELRDELKSHIRSYVTDRAAYAVIEPDARTRAMMLRGSKPGTVPGELLRFIGQFKAFPVAILQKSFGRELYGRGYTPSAYGANLQPLRELAQALKSGNGEKLGMLQLLLWTTAFGYLAMTAKDMAKGRNPRDPTSPETWTASMLQGGALGIYGDYLFGEVNRFGGSPIQTAAGPVLGMAEGGVQLFHKIKNGDDAAATAFRFALNNTPYLNLFYTRPILDYGLFYQLQENMNPGYLRRMERRVEDQNKQTFMVKPSEVFQ